MATINFEFRGKSEKGNLTLRLKHSTSIDYRISSKIVSHRKYWFKTNGKKRRLDELSYLSADAKEHKLYLETVKNDILLKFKNDFNNGVAISKEWFIDTIEKATDILSTKKEIVDTQNEIDKKEKERLDTEKDIYTKNLLTTAIQRVIDIEYFNNKGQQNIFRQALRKLKIYQEERKTIIQTKDVTQDFINLFTAFLIDDLKHQQSVAKKHCKSIVHSVKYQRKAFPEEVKITEGLGEIKYIKLSKAENRKRRDEIVVTLSFDELDTIYNTEVPQRLINAKKVILLISEIGLRVSDFNKLVDENLKKENDFEYWSFWNKKTGTDVVIPKNDRIKKYIKAYGEPYTEYTRTDEVIINREIKEVCELAGINQIIESRKSVSVIVKGEKTRRTVSSTYKKYEVISCHSLRRTFCTNYRKILELADIRQISGHSSDEQLLEYINQSQEEIERTNSMLKKMNKNAKKLKKKTKLKIVKKASDK